MKKILPILIRILWAIFVIALPFLGFWLTSSLAAFQNFSVAIAAFVGLLSFPLLPFGWEAFAKYRRRQREGDPQREVKPHILTLWDRLILRTLAVNLALLTVLATNFPVATYTAASARGDWMLPDREGPVIDRARNALFSMAQGLEWLYQWTYDNPYDSQIDGDDHSDTGERRGGVLEQRSVSAEADGDSSYDDWDLQHLRRWPLPQMVHPLIEDFPADVETSIESVATYIADHEADPYSRVKALYDYVATRVEYDVDTYFGRTPRAPQDAQTVFDTGLGVCEGYARLLVELGRHSGDDIRYITGLARVGGSEDDVDGEYHAWNAVEVHGSWYLIDVTWGSGYILDNREFVAAYDSTYLFAPPHVLINTHLPDDAQWQLLDEPITRGEFLRQPMLRPAFFARGMELVSPTRSQVTARDEIEITLRAPRDTRIYGWVRPRGGVQSDMLGCQSEEGFEPRLFCPLPKSGTYTVEISGYPDRRSRPEFWGSIEVISR
jgi:hypothetical protein